MSRIEGDGEGEDAFMIEGDKGGLPKILLRS